MTKSRNPTGYVGVTDEDWYRYLATRPDLDEVNFWRPRDKRRFAGLQVGEPFFFKLKKPWNAVVGFGYFLRFVFVPLSLAWEAFEEKNGAPNRDAMRERIIRLGRHELGPGDDPEVGCVLLSEPTFFPQEQWIAQPRDFHRNLVQGKGYDLVVGEGRRLWESCMARAHSNRESLRDEPPRFGAAGVTTPRLGQGAFRVSVTDAYDRRCAVTGEHALPVLEAAHILPYSDGGAHDIRNGLLLRSDIHRLYDRGLVTVTPDLAFRVSPELRERWRNGETYYRLCEQLSDRTIHVPKNASEHPDAELLDWHSSNRFRA